ncbi:MAG: DUF4386 domain-containing protein [Candidatus Thorarchaeota archaeon]|nr:MAG: DUF4386 domain-containing protein [Candidatus Thorarchaeota archaeon]
MNSEINAARMTGILFIAATGAAIVSGAFLLPILEAPDYLAQISANQTQVMLGALFYFIMAAAGAAIVIPMYPILKKHSESMALGAVGFRLIEGAIFMVGVFLVMALVPLSQGFVDAGSPADSAFQTIGAILVSGYTIDHAVVPAVFAFSIGALMYYFIFYQSKLVPRWLSVWGIIGVLLGVANGLLDMFGGVPFEAISMLLDLPIFVNEMVLAVWLIVKGFDSS